MRSAVEYRVGEFADVFVFENKKRRENNVISNYNMLWNGCAFCLPMHKRIKSVLDGTSKMYRKKDFVSRYDKTELVV